jgi:hypothetical protein
LHCGQRTFNTVLPRNTANGTRIAAWHLLQITRIESVGAGATAGLAAATGCGIAPDVAFVVIAARFDALPNVCVVPTGAFAPAAASPTLATAGRVATVFTTLTVPTPNPGIACVGTVASFCRTGWML